MADLFDIYPELRRRVDALCRGLPWCVTGASALVYDTEAFYFEITKPEHWQHRPDGALVAGIGAIGGSLEQGETILDCLYREAEEEVNARIEVESAQETHLVYEQRTLETVAAELREYPLPVLCTISENLYRRERLPGCSILVIVTFLARLAEKPTPHDLFGLLVIPRQALAAVFAPEETALARLRQISGVEIWTTQPLPEGLVLSPVWTGRSFQLLLQAGRLNAKGVHS